MNACLHHGPTSCDAAHHCFSRLTRRYSVKPVPPQRTIVTLLISICLDIRADVIFVRAQNSGEQVGPLAELDAWTERAKRLNSIDAQLTGPGITQVGQVLKAADSAYYPAFNRCGPQSQLRGAVLHLL